MTIYKFLEELIIIAERADTERLLVLWPQFKVEYPEFAADIEHCLSLQPYEIRSYLTHRYDFLTGVFAIARPQWLASIDNALTYLHANLKGRI